MMVNRLLCHAAAATALVLVSSASADPRVDVPGWFISGSAAKKYQALVDESVAHSGSSSASLAATADVDGSQFGTLMQFVDARPHVGERVRFSAYVRTAGVTTGAALWMRIDDVEGDVVAFDNMSDRAMIRGGQPWGKAEIVLDVPPDSKLLSFGVLLKGEGMVWIDSASLEPVSRHIATTGLSVPARRLPVAPDDLPLAPVNLDFEG